MKDREWQLIAFLLSLVATVIVSIALARPLAGLNPYVRLAITVCLIAVIAHLLLATCNFFGVKASAGRNPAAESPSPSEPESEGER